MPNTLLFGISICIILWGKREGGRELWTESIFERAVAILIPKAKHDMGIVYSKQLQFQFLERKCFENGTGKH